MLIDSGGGKLGAKKLHQAIQAVTQKPVRYVVNSGSQTIAGLAMISLLLWVPK